MNNLNVQDAIRALKRGEIIIFPTDTAFGIGCRMDDPLAVKRIFEIKRRSTENALLVLVDSVKMAESYVKIPQVVRTKLINQYWPGGVSIFFHRKKEKVLDVVTGGTDVLAVRMPDHIIIRKIITGVGVPIIATSANVSGEGTPYSLSEVSDEILNSVDAVLKGECTYKKESTIIDTTVTPWSIIRAGAVNVSF